MAKDLDLGKSTSYAYYVAEGGTKTPQEYGEMLVNIDTVATRAEDAADSAAESASNASRDADRAEQAAAQSGYLWFYIENGKLYMDRTQNTHVNFFMQDGKLYVEEVS